MNIPITKEYSYLIGLLQTDGHFQESSRNRGKITIELSLRDKDIIDKITALIPVNYKISQRTRNTNFKKDYTSIILTIYDWGFREFMKTCGLPVGKKSEIIAPPLHLPISEPDYIRGLYDGDGSLGLKQTGGPFISLTTASEDIKDYILVYMSKILGIPHKQLKRNKRDNIYNIGLSSLDAVNFTKHIYYENCLGINRKIEKANEVTNWSRPTHIRKQYRSKRWTKSEDDFVLQNTLKDSCEQLNRTKQSVLLRLWRLGKRKNDGIVNP
jgi:hypothetical protein